MSSHKFKILKYAIYFILLTLITQVGGIIFLCFLILLRVLRVTFPKNWKGYFFKVGIFFLFYGLISVFLIPPLASLNHRTTLPILSSSSLRPANPFLYFFNRHYVKVEFKELLLELAETGKSKVSNLPMIYLDANFPFWDGFPLLPHLSHNDGKKIDFHFLYQDQEGQPIQKSPSFWGYGFIEKPKPNEINWSKKCKKEGSWWYGLTQNWLFTPRNSKYALDENATRQLLIHLAQHPKTEKIFIEPNLKARLRLQHLSKIRFQGCHSVRHDDHIHLQMR